MSRAEIKKRQRIYYILRSASDGHNIFDYFKKLDSLTISGLFF